MHNALSPISCADAFPTGSKPVAPVETSGPAGRGARWKLGLLLGVLVCGGCNSTPSTSQSSIPWDPRALPTPQLDPGPIVVWPFSAGGNGHSFQAVAAPNGINWADAEALAVAHGGHLASIKSEAENRFVFSLIDAPKFWSTTTNSTGIYHFGPWLGGLKSPDSRQPDEGWHWIDGGDAFTYTRWAANQPSNTNGNEDRLQYYVRGAANSRQLTWNDQPRNNAEEHGFVVEYSSGVSGPEVSGPSPLSFDPGLPSSSASGMEGGPVVQWAPAAGGNGHFFQAVSVPNGINWADAEAVAVAHGGHLATITSSAENNFVFSLIDDPKYWTRLSGWPQYNLGPWLGGFKSPDSRRPDEGWQWLNNDGPFNFTAWAPGHPNNTAGISNVLQFFDAAGSGRRRATWNDSRSLLTMRGFVVEYPAGISSGSGGPQSGPGVFNQPMSTRPAPPPSGFGPALDALDPGPVVPWPLAVGGNGHAFQAVCTPGGINWADAEAWAVAHGGFLASITSAAENDLIFRLVDDPKYWINGTSYTVGPWLGGVKTPGVTRPDEGWQWLNNGGPFIYTNWAPGQPDNDRGRGGENRLQFMGNGTNNRQPTWNDTKETLHEHGFVVEYSSGPAGIPGSGQTPGGFAPSAPPAPTALEAGPVVLWPIAVGGNGHTFQAFFVANGITWPEAQAVAIARGGNLASIHSEAENNFVFDLVRDPRFWRPGSNGGNYLLGPWLGGFHLPGSPPPTAGWRWVEGNEPFAYTHWAARQPDGPVDGNYTLHFMASLGSGPQSTWDDQPTDTANIKGFVVEYGVGAINPPMPTRLPPSLSGSGPAPAALDPGPVVPWPFSAGGNGHAFQAVCAPNGINWADAEAWAVAHGGHLASIHSMAENYLVFSLVNDPKFWNNATYDSVVYSIGPWLGGVKSPGVTAPAAGWQWFDGGGPFTYTNWALGQPDNDHGRGGENRLQLFATGPDNRQPTWNDTHETSVNEHGFVVEYPNGAASPPVQGFEDPRALKSAPSGPFGPLPPSTRPPPPPRLVAPAPAPVREAGPVVTWPVAAGGNGHSFQAVAAPDGINWADAQAWAVAHGGNLAVITSEAENNFVFNLVAEPKYWYPVGGNNHGPWLGGVKTPGETRPAAGWRWLNNAGPVFYTNWAPGQPNNDTSRGPEDRIQYLANGANNLQPTWNDVSGALATHGFVVEYSTGPAGSLGSGPMPGSFAPSAPPASPALDPGPLVQWAVAAGGNGHFDQPVAASNGITWPDAEVWASVHGGHLATITSAAENSFVFSLIDDPRFWRTALTTVGTECHLGPWLGGVKAPDATAPDAGWYWVNGDGPFQFTNWARQQPDNHGGNEDRLNFYSWENPDRAPTWNDQPGGSGERGFVVEYAGGSAPVPNLGWDEHSPSPSAAAPGVGGLKIISAIFSGHGGEADVTALLVERVRPGADVMFASPKWLGVDPAPYWKKELAIAYEFGGRRATYTTREGGAISYELLMADAGVVPVAAAAPAGEPKVVSAYFGTGDGFADVTARVAELIRTEPAGFATTEDELQADPTPGLRKEFMVVYEYGGQRRVFTTHDGGMCSRDLLVQNPAKDAAQSGDSDDK
jgi:hypothetical protein